MSVAFPAIPNSKVQQNAIVGESTPSGPSATPGLGGPSDLELLSRSLSGAPQEDSESNAVVPPVPETLEDTGLGETFVQQLILKILYSRGDMLGRELSEALGLKFSLIEKVIDFLKHQHFIEAKKSLGMGNSTVLFALGEGGKNFARECMESNQYAGPAPVPLAQYTELIRKQRRADGWLTPEALKARLSQDGGDAARSGSDRPGGELGKFVPDLWAAGKRENVPGRSADERGRFVRLYSPRAGLSGHHHSGVRSALSSAGGGHRGAICIRKRPNSMIAGGSSAGVRSLSPAAS